MALRSLQSPLPPTSRRPARSAARRPARPVCAAEASPELATAAFAECEAELAALGLDSPALTLRKAHGWGFQGYWRKSKEDEVPDLGLLRERLAFLAPLVGGDPQALRDLVAKFPEALGLDVATVMQPNVVRGRAQGPCKERGEKEPRKRPAALSPPAHLSRRRSWRRRTG